MNKEVITSKRHIPSLLKGDNFDNKILKGFDLSTHGLFSVYLNNSELVECHLVHITSSDLRDTLFKDCDLRYCGFNESDIRGITFDNCKLKDVILSTSIHNKEDILNIGKDDDIPVINNIFQKLYEVCSIKDQFDMGTWEITTSGCGTVRCIAGWSVYLGGSLGRKLEEKYGYDMAALLILCKNSKFEFEIDFYETSNKRALIKLKELSDKEVNNH